MIDPQKTFDSTVKAKGNVTSQTLRSFLEQWLAMSDTDLNKANASFLKAITTYIVRQFKKRRKGGVPVGYLDKFILPHDQKINLFDVLAAMVVSIMRKRGLREVQEQAKNPALDLLQKAFDRTSKYETKN